MPWQLDEYHQRLSACPPHLRMKIIRQSLIIRENHRPASERIGLSEQIEAIVRRMGGPDPTIPTGKPIDFRWHRRRWLP